MTNILTTTGNLQKFNCFPYFPKVPSIESKLRTLTIRIKDTLEPNTTYYYNFGNAIKDVNEGNMLHNFLISFQQGIHLIHFNFREKFYWLQTED